MAKKELTRNQRIIAMITVVALLIYAIVNAFLVIFAYAKLNRNVQQLRDVATNWEQEAIQDIVVAASCPTGYEAAFSGRQWYGVDTGCWCGDVSDATLESSNVTCTPFCDEECSTYAIRIGCEDVAGKDAVDLTYWGSISSGARQICIKRSTETWGNTASITEDDGTCPSGYTQCGTSDSNVFCTQETDCPITSITIENTASCGVDPNCIVLDDGTVTSVSRVLKYKRGSSEDALPLAEMRLNEDGMCIVVATDEITPTRKNFPLLSKRISTCNGAGDDRWSISGSLTETQLFSINALSTYISGLSGFTSTGMDNGYYETGMSGDDYEWRVFSRGYIPWDLSCRDQFENFLAKTQQINNLKDAQLTLLVIGLISTLIIGIILSWMEIQNLRGVDLSCISGKGEEERAKLTKFKKIMSYGFKFLVIPFQIWAIVITSKTKGTFGNVVDRDCSNVDTNDMISYFSTTLSSTYRSNITAIAITLASLCFDLFMTFCRKKDDEKIPGNVISPAPKNGDKTEMLKLNPSDERSQLNSPHGMESPGNPFAKNNLRPNGPNPNHFANSESPAPNQNNGTTITINYGEPQGQQQFGSNPFAQPQNQPPFQQQQQQPQPFSQPPYQQQNQFGSNPFAQPH